MLGHPYTRHVLKSHFTYFFTGYNAICMSAVCSPGRHVQATQRLRPVAAGAMARPQGVTVLANGVMTSGLLARHISGQMNDYCPYSSLRRCEMFYTATMGM
jgi:hypothetical protein